MYSYLDLAFNPKERVQVVLLYVFFVVWFGAFFPLPCWLAERLWVLWRSRSMIYYGLKVLSVGVLEDLCI